MKNERVVDGSRGEGGGQILRTTATLAALGTRPVRIENIRANRPRPGMAAQHLTAVRAAAEVSGARLEGDELRSTRLRFVPGEGPAVGDYRFDVSEALGSRSAGSAGLVLQTVLPLLARGKGTSRVEIAGGTHVAWSPPFHYLRDVYGWRLQQIGFSVELGLERWGFYPRGGGLIRATVRGGGPGWAPRGFNREKRGELRRLEGFSAVSNLDPNIGVRQAREAERLLDEAGFVVELEERIPDSDGPGTVVLLLATYEHGRAGFVGYGKRGKPAEIVAREAVEAFLDFDRTDCVVDFHLADQLVVPLSLSREPSRYRTERITSHLETNLQVAETLGTLCYQLEGEEGSAGTVRIAPEPRPGAR